MARKDVDLYNIDTLPENLRDALLQLRQDFDAHTHDGVNSASITTLTVENMNARVFSIRKTSFDSTIAGLWVGLVDKYVYWNLGDSSNFLKYNGQTGALTLQGDMTAGSININNGVASIDSSGNAVFKSVNIGGSVTQYAVSDSGIFSFGDGSDGSADLDGTNTYGWASKSGNTYTLTRDVYLTDLDIGVGVTLKPAGYRVFGTGTLDCYGTIQRNGNAGTDGVDATDASSSPPSSSTAGTGGAAGAAISDGYLKGSPAGAAGGTGGSGEFAGNGKPNNQTGGSSGTGVTNSIGFDGVSGGQGGTGANRPSGSESGASGGGGGTATASNVKLIANWHLATMLDVSSTGSTVKFTGSASGGAGGGGAGAAAVSGGNNYGGSGGGGGGSGSPGAILNLYFRDIIVESGGSIQSVGGNGGDGGKGGDGDAGDAPNDAGGAGGGGGGAPGNGGEINLVYNSLTNNGSISAAAGTAGTGGAAGLGMSRTLADGTAGSNGSTGTDGNIRLFAMSL